MSIVRSACWLLAGSAILSTAAAAAIVEIKQAIGKAGVVSDIGSTRIVVNGKGSAAYDHVSNATVDAWLRISGNDEPRRPVRFVNGEIKVEGGTAPIQKPGAAKIYKVSFPYIAPRSHSVANQRVNPVKLCNDRLKALSGAAREEFLKKGTLFAYPDAYSARAGVTWRVKRGGFEEFEGHNDTVMIRATIDCRPLAGPKVRSSTTSGGSPGAVPRAKGPEPKRTAPPPTRTAPPPVRTGSAPVRTGPTPVRTSDPAAEAFDARIRLADRKGPAGAVRLFVYNAGPGAVEGCSIGWRVSSAGEFQRIANVQPIAARQTIELEGALPDNANSEFQIECPGEPADALANNIFLVE